MLATYCIQWYCFYIQDRERNLISALMLRPGYVNFAKTTSLLHAMAITPRCYEVAPDFQYSLGSLQTIDIESGLKEFVLAAGYAVLNAPNQCINHNTLVEALKNHVYTSKGNVQTGLGTSDGQFYRRIGELDALGCVHQYSEERTINGEKRKYKIYRFGKLASLIKHLESNGYSSPAKQVGRYKKSTIDLVESTIGSSGVIKLEAGDVTPFTEHAFTILDVATASPGKHETLIECDYQITKDDHIKITATTSGKGMGVAMTTDQRVWLALNGMLRRAGEANENDLFGNAQATTMLRDGYCFVDLMELTEEIGLSRRSAQSRGVVRDILQRAYHTDFEVDATNSPFWRKNFSGGAERANYRYLTEFYEAKQFIDKGIGTEDELPVQILEGRYYVFKFHSIIFKAMTGGGNAFLTHDSLKTERADLVHRFNNWVKGVVGVRPKDPSSNRHLYPLDLLKQRVRPQSRTDNFEQSLLSLAQRQDTPENRKAHPEAVALATDDSGRAYGTFWLNGYYFRLYYDSEKLTELYRLRRQVNKRRRLKEYPIIEIWRDRMDPIVGDNSPHMKALAARSEGNSSQGLVQNRVENEPFGPNWQPGKLALDHIAAAVPESTKESIDECRALFVSRQLSKGGELPRNLDQYFGNYFVKFWFEFGGRERAQSVQQDFRAAIDDVSWQDDESFNPTEFKDSLHNVDKKTTHRLIEDMEN